MKKILKDCFNISKRIKRINGKYSLKYDYRRKQYVLFYGNHLEITFSASPSFLFYRKVLESRMDNAEKILKNNDEFNDKLLKNIVKNEMRKKGLG